MGMLGFVSLVFMVVFLLILVIGTQKFLRIFKMAYRTKYKICIGYVGVLLLGTIIYFSFIQPKYEAVEENKEDVPGVLEIGYNTPKQVHDLSNEWIVEDWNFTIEKKKLTLEMYDGSLDDGFAIPVIVEEHESTKEVHAQLYHFPLVYGDQILEGQSVIPNVQIDNQTFIFSFPDEYKEVSFYGVENDMMYQHFNDSPRFDAFEMRQDSGQILYIQVPEGTKVQADDDFLEIIRID